MKRFTTSTLSRLWAPALMALFLTTSPAQAQGLWQQTVQIITPVEDLSLTQALLDTLVVVVQRNEIPVKRTPEDELPRSFRSVEDEILNEGLDFSSATHLFITYQYRADQHGLRTQIEDLYFIFRDGATDEADIPILYLEGEEPAIRNTLMSSGTQLATNEAAFLPFWDQLMISKLDKSSVVAVSGNIIRDEEEADMAKANLLETIRRLMY